MKETVEFRINYDYYHLLFDANEGKDLGQFSKSIKIVELSKNDHRYNQIPVISNELKEKYGKTFFFGWKIKRKYSKKELDEAKIFQVKIKTAFEPAGEDCGTIYDDDEMCEICGCNRKQVGKLKLISSSIPKKDIARTIAGELIASEKFALLVKEKNMKGLNLIPVEFDKNRKKVYQVKPVVEFNLSKKTITGNDPFAATSGSKGGTFEISGYKVEFEDEIYECPKGHLIGLNLLSEAFIVDEEAIKGYDFFASKQKIGVKRGFLQPEPIYLCSPLFRKMVFDEKLTGFEFEPAYFV